MCNAPFFIKQMKSDKMQIVKHFGLQNWWWQTWMNGFVNGTLSG